MVVEACELDATKDGNTVLLNESTYGVVYEVQLNKTLTLSYLDSGKKYLYMPDSNHNSKNFRGQMVSGTSAASIGIWMLKMANVAREIYCIGY